MALPAKSPKVLLQGVVVATVFALLALRQHLFVDSYAVNAMFWDQWDFYRPLFQGASLWEMFSWQHGPHRQGVGFLLTAILAELSGWNSRWDAFGVSWVLIGAALLGLQLARRCRVSGVVLIAIPLLFFNLRQYEIFVGAANISHGAMPMLLLMALCLSWFVERPGARWVLLVFLTFCSIFTGFGIFTGLVVPLVLLAVLWHGRRRLGEESMIFLCLAAIAFSWLLFAQGYRFDPAVQGFRFPHERPWEYLLFMATMLNNFFGIRGHDAATLGVGLLLLLGLASLAGLHLSRLCRHGLVGQERSAVIATLALFALIYCAQTAVGRVVLGWREAAGSSRYVPLLIPAGLAIFLHLAGLPQRYRPTVLSLVFVTVVAIGTLRLHGADKRFVGHYSIGRVAWKGVYLATGDIGKAGEAANFLIYPTMEIGDRLEVLRQRKHNLFNPEGRP